MKKLLTLLIFVFCVQLRAQTSSSSCTASDSIIKLYKPDAQRMALRHEYATHMGDTENVAINHSLVSNYLAALIAVYNATDVPARDTVITLFNLHTNPNPELNLIAVNANPSNNWMQSLQNGIIPTSYAPIDTLINRYSLHEQTYYQSSPYDVVIFRRDSASNMAYIAKQFAAQPTISSAAAPVGINDTKNITDSVNAGFTILRYTYGWGDCTAGCSFHSTWSFQVFPDCTVKFLGHTGDQYVNVGTGIRQDEVFNNLSIYPNPVSDQLFVKFNSEKPTDTELEIVNAVGQILRHQNIYNSAIVDLENLAPGFYFVRLKNDAGQRIVKIVKE